MGSLWVYIRGLKYHGVYKDAVEYQGVYTKNPRDIYRSTERLRFQYGRSHMAGGPVSELKNQEFF